MIETEQTTDVPVGDWTPPPPPGRPTPIQRLKALKGRLLSRLRGEENLPALVAQGLELGENVYVGSGSTIDGGCPWLVSIGDHTTISAGVHILVHDASTRRHIGYSVVAPVRIGRRVYVGAGAIILPGVTIGDDAIVGAGALVRHDVPAGHVVVGVPARVVSTTEEYVESHRAQLATRPCYPAEGYTALGGPTDETRRRMREELADGHGYVR